MSRERNWFKSTSRKSLPLTPELDGELELDAVAPSIRDIKSPVNLLIPVVPTFETQSVSAF
jgi:hypothetical protein